MESAGGWRDYLIPFCGSDGSYLVINTRSDEIYEFEAGEGVGDCVDTSFSSHLGVLIEYIQCMHYM